MLFLKIARRPAWYSQSFYTRDAGLSEQDYTEQFSKICGDFFGPVDTWSTVLNAKGLEAVDLIGGIHALDKAWLMSHDQPTALSGFDVLKAQIKFYDPDVLFLEGIEVFSDKEIEAFRSIIRKSAKICGLTGTDIRSKAALYSLDAVFSCMKGLVFDLNNRGTSAFFLPHSFDPRILEHFPEQKSERETVNMIGNFVSGSHMHDFRVSVAEQLIRDHGMKVYSNYEKNKLRALSRYSKLKLAYGLGKIAKSLPVKTSPVVNSLLAAEAKGNPVFKFSDLISSSAQPGAYGLAQYELLRRSLVTVNVHAGLAEDFAANMRLFEATGIGTALATDMKSDLDEFFEPDKEVISFSSAAEASEKIGFLIDNPNVAREIAEQGQRRCLRDHTFESRAEILLDGLSQLGIPIR